MYKFFAAVIIVVKDLNWGMVMAIKTVHANIVEAFGREFVQGNVPEINEVRCMGCSHCAVLCKKLGPNVLDIQGGPCGGGKA